MEVNHTIENSGPKKYYAENVPEGYYSPSLRIKRINKYTWIIIALVAGLFILGLSSCDTPNPSNKPDIESVPKVVKDKRDVAGNTYLCSSCPATLFYLIATDGSYTEVSMEESFTTNIGDTVYSSNWRK